MNTEDFVGDPCDCPECRQAGISEPVRRDPSTGRWLHGYDLRRWYDARERCLAEIKRVSDSLQGDGFKRVGR